MGSLRIFVNDGWVEPEAGLGGARYGEARYGAVRYGEARYGAPALDFIRGELGLTGTKEGCREGDCGACAVLVGEFAEAPEGGKSAGEPRYRALPSCLLALGDLAGKHLITIEGLSASSPDGLTPVMRAFLEENASQCGFCSPGFVIALSAWLAGTARPDLAGAMTAVDGNLCRCTGYGAIRRAAERLAVEFGTLPEDAAERLGFLVEKAVLPRSVLAFLEKGRAEEVTAAQSRGGIADAAIGGGTDWFVRNPYPEADFKPLLLRSTPGMAGIATIAGKTEIPGGRREGAEWLRVGAAVTVTDFFASKLVREALPGIEKFESQFASSLIRNLATIGGNVANASPVGDITSMLMGLGAVLELGEIPSGQNPALHSEPRFLAIEDFFVGYKKTALKRNEILLAVLIPADAGIFFSFEKIAKREKLDIAAVNTAMSFRVEGGRIAGVRISAGGVAAIPVLLEKAAALFEGAPVDRDDPKTLAAFARAVSSAAREEVSPISDVRGSAAYRKRMTGRLVLAHFIRLFEDAGIAKELFP
ncbi:MAG: FAD binding domain-containing protein [Rectinemataceae bacterium]